MPLLRSGPMESDPAPRRRFPSSRKLLSIGERWNVPSVSLCAQFPPFNPYETHEPSFLLISFQLRHPKLLFTFTPPSPHPTAQRPFTACLRPGLVLSRERQLLKVLRPSNMHRMFCPNQAIRTDDHTLGFRTGGLSLLRAGAFRSSVHSTSLENRDRWRQFGVPSLCPVRRRGLWKSHLIFVRLLPHGRIPLRGHRCPRSQ